MDGNARPLLRAVMVGVIAGLFVSGLVLLVIGARGIAMGPDCSGLTDVECGLERDILLGIARRQVLVGGAMSLLGLAIFMMIKRRTS